MNNVMIPACDPALQRAFNWTDQRVHARYDLRLDWKRVKKGTWGRLKDALKAIDRDLYDDWDTLYYDGYRVRWRHPHGTLRDVFAVLRRNGIEEVRGYCLPSGWNCGCMQEAKEAGAALDLGSPDPRVQPDYPHCMFKLGDGAACDAQPGENDWFVWKAGQEEVR
jgi:hypothetical protein